MDPKSKLNSKHSFIAGIIHYKLKLGKHFKLNRQTNRKPSIQGDHNNQRRKRQTLKAQGKRRNRPVTTGVNTTEHSLTNETRNQDRS